MNVEIWKMGGNKECVVVRVSYTSEIQFNTACSIEREGEKKETEVGETNGVVRRTK